MVNFTLKGVEALQSTLKGVQGQLAQVQAGAAAVGQAAETAFGRARTALLGFVAAGTAASTEGQVLGMRMEMLSRSIAGLFGPEIRAVSRAVQDLTNWLSRLSDAQRENIARWLMGGAAALSAAAVLPRVIAGAQGLAAALGALTAGPLGGLLAVAGAVAAAFAAVKAGEAAAQGASGLEALFAGVKPVVEAVTATLSRLWDALKPVWEALGRVAAGLADLLKPLLPDLSALAVAAGGLLAEGLRAVLTAVEALMATGILDFFREMIRLVVGPLTSALRFLAGVLQSTVNAFRALAGLRPPQGDRPRPERPEEHRRQLAPRIGGFESTEGIWSRLAQASLAVTAGMGRNIDEQQLDELRGVNERLDRIGRGLDNQRPAVARDHFSGGGGSW